MYKSLEIDDTNVYKGHRYKQAIITAIFMLLILAGLLGLFGSGYFSSAQSGDENSDFKILYPRFLRNQTDFQINIDINKIDNDESLSLWIDSELLNYFSILEYAPIPENMSLKDGQMILTYNVDSYEGRMRLAIMLRPVRPGFTKWKAGIVGGDVCEIKQFIYP